MKAMLLKISMNAATIPVFILLFFCSTRLCHGEADSFPLEEQHIETGVNMTGKTEQDLWTRLSLFVNPNVYCRRSESLANLPSPTTTVAALNLPNMRAEIVRGLRTFSFTLYPGTVLPMSKNAQSILVSPKEGRSILVASTVGKGRVLAGGYNSMLWDLRRGTHMLWRQAAKWLSKGAQPRFYPANSVNRNDFNSPGGIIYWNGHEQISKDKSKLIRDLVVSGKAGVMYALRGVYDGDFDKADLDLMLEAGIYFHRHFWGTWGKQDWDLTKSSDVDTMSFANRLRWIFTGKKNILSNQIKVMIQIINGIPAKATKLLDRDVARKLMKHYESFATQVAPCARNPAKSEEVKTFLRIYGYLLRSSLLIDSGIKAPNVNIFPGSVPDNAPRVVSDLEIKAPRENEMHATGLYLPAGGTLSVEVLSGNADISNWEIRISCHTDNVEQYYKVDFKRFPIITNTMKLDEKKVFNGFGGVVIVTNVKAGGSIKLRFKGAVQSPYFNLRDTKNMAAWDSKRKFAPGPWTEVAGDAIVYCLPTSAVKKYSSAYLKDVMTNYVDRFVKGDHHFRGSNWKTSRRERFSVDVQISAGYGHAGYPIQAIQDSHWVPSLIDVQSMKTVSSWGLFHEVGHNMQRPVWTFGGTGEVTNNVFALFNRDQWGQVFFEKYDTFTSRLQDTRSYLLSSSRTDFENKWKKDPFLALFIYAQFGHHFGWGFYKRVFRKYLQDNIELKSDAEKIEKWIIITSQVRGYNLIPTFDFWGFPISETAKTKLRGLPMYLPDDFVTKNSPRRVSAILAKYRNVKRSIAKMSDPYIGEMKFFKEIRANDVIPL